MHNKVLSCSYVYSLQNKKEKNTQRNDETISKTTANFFVRQAAEFAVINRAFPYPLTVIGA